MAIIKQRKGFFKTYMQKAPIKNKFALWGRLAYSTNTNIQQMLCANELAKPYATLWMFFSQHTDSVRLRRARVKWFLAGPMLAKALAKVLPKVLAKALAQVLSKVFAKVLARFVFLFCWRTLHYKLPPQFGACIIWRLVPQFILPHP